MQTIRQLFFKVLVCSTLLAGVVFSQSSLTQIRDTVLNSDGTPFNGTVVITWNGFTGPSGGIISPLSTSARIYNGALSVLLVPTTTAAAGTYYQAIYNSSDGTVTWTENWQVPASTTALTLSAVRVTGSTGSTGSTGTGTGSSGTGSGTGSSGTGQYATLPISINQVTSLSADLASINSSIAALSTQIAGLSSSSTSAAFVDGEIPAGALNSSNATFTLSQTPSPAPSLLLYRNGLLQTLGLDYTVAGSTITFLPVSLPKSSDAIAAYYRVAGTGPTSTFADAETPSGTLNGTNLIFTLANSPLPASSLKLYQNGVLLSQGNDYSLSGSTITFASSGAVPQRGDVLSASYRY